MFAGRVFETTGSLEFPFKSWFNIISNFKLLLERKENLKLHSLQKNCIDFHGKREKPTVCFIFILFVFFSELLLHLHPPKLSNFKHFNMAWHLSGEALTWLFWILPFFWNIKKCWISSYQHIFCKAVGTLKLTKEGVSFTNQFTQMQLRKYMEHDKKNSVVSVIFHPNMYTSLLW